MATTNPNPIPPLTQLDIIRFWRHVDKRGPNDCWPWRSMVTEDGYGRFKYQRVERKANRIVYFLTTGEDPGPDFRVLHSCPNGDLPACCNPAHLRKGTVIENVEDRDKRGRTARGDRSGPRLYPGRLMRGDKHYARLHPETKQGERNGMAKLSVEQVLEIRARYDAGERNFRAFGAEFGVSGNMISWIGHRKFWKSIPG